MRPAAAPLTLTAPEVETGSLETTGRLEEVARVVALVLPATGAALGAPAAAAAIAATMAA